MTVSRQDKLPATPTNLRQQMLDNLGAPSLAQRQSPTVNELGGWIEHGLCYGISSKDGRTAARLLLDRFNIVPKDAALAPGNGAVEAATRDKIYTVVLKELETKRRMPTSVTLACAITNAVCALHPSPAPDAVRALPVISIKPMALLDGRTDYFVAITIGDREITPYKLGHEWQAAYEADSFRWLLLGDPKPDLLAYGPDGWPRRAALPDDGRRG